MSRIKTPDEYRFGLMLGVNLKFLRLRKGFSPMKIVAYHLGITHQQVAKYENGKNVPCAYRLTQLADFYKVKTDDLVNPDFINQQSKTPQDAGYLKPQKDIGSMEEIKPKASEILDYGRLSAIEGGIDDEDIEMIDEEHFNRHLNK